MEKSKVSLYIDGFNIYHRRSKCGYWTNL